MRCDNCKTLEEEISGLKEKISELEDEIDEIESELEFAMPSQDAEELKNSLYAVRKLFDEKILCRGCQWIDIKGSGSCIDCTIQEAMKKIK